MEEIKDTTPAPEAVKYDNLIVSDGTRYKTLLTRKYKERKPYRPADPGIIKSFIPGTIRKINFQEGQIVEKGETILILEAMKMMNNVMAPIDGEIKKLHVSIGQVVANKVVLVELKPVKIERKPVKKNNAKGNDKTKDKVKAKSKADIKSKAKVSKETSPKSSKPAKKKK